MGLYGIGKLSQLIDAFDNANAYGIAGLSLSLFSIVNTYSSGPSISVIIHNILLSIVFWAISAHLYFTPIV